jgi:hypothetical protein
MPRVAPVDAIEMQASCAAEIATVPSAGEGQRNGSRSNRFGIERHAIAQAPET